MRIQTGGTAASPRLARAAPSSAKQPPGMVTQVQRAARPHGAGRGGAGEAGGAECGAERAARSLLGCGLSRIFTPLGRHCQQGWSRGAGRGRADELLGARPLPSELERTGPGPHPRREAAEGRRRAGGGRTTLPGVGRPDLHGGYGEDGDIERARRASSPPQSGGHRAGLKHIGVSGQQGSLRTCGAARETYLSAACHRRYTSLTARCSRSYTFVART